jgi:flagellar assembly factor FliW
MFQLRFLYEFNIDEEQKENMDFKSQKNLMQK